MKGNDVHRCIKSWTVVFLSSWYWPNTNSTRWMEQVIFVAGWGESIRERERRSMKLLHKIQPNVYSVRTRSFLYVTIDNAIFHFVAVWACVCAHIRSHTHTPKKRTNNAYNAKKNKWAKIEFHIFHFNFNRSLSRSSNMGHMHAFSSYSLFIYVWYSQMSVYHFIISQLYTYTYVFAKSQQKKFV